jgi:hypothetical protein
VEYRLTSIGLLTARTNASFLNSCKNVHTLAEAGESTTALPPIHPARIPTFASFVRCPPEREIIPEAFLARPIPGFPDHLHRGSVLRRQDTTSTGGAIDPFVATCYKCPFCTRASGEVLISPAAGRKAPTRPSSNTPFQVCGGSVFGIPATESPCAALGMLGRGMLGRKALSRHVCIFPKPTHLEDSLCAPGSPLLRSKDAVW